MWRSYSQGVDSRSQRRHHRCEPRGVVAVKVPAGGKRVDVSSFEGETEKLPAGIEAIRSHECFQCASGVYLGPCSGGRDHTYTVYVYAKNAKGETLAKGQLSLGCY